MAFLSFSSLSICVCRCKTEPQPKTNSTTDDNDDNNLHILNDSVHITIVFSFKRFLPDF